MEEQAQDTNSRPGHGSGGVDSDLQRTEPVRSRWTPKPEQILILESIFNSGMVNPPKNETVRIRKMLEKFGSVGDANVFYWFQNRRSRSRRRQRQLQATLSPTATGGEQLQAQPRHGGGGGDGIYQYDNSVPGGGFIGQSMANYGMNSTGSCFVGSSSSYGFGGINDHGGHSESLFGFSGHPGPVQDFEQSPVFFSPDASNLHYQSDEVITVFINGEATEVGRSGLVDMKAVLGGGGDFVLFHSSGVPILANEYGFVASESLQHGESYFLIPRQS